MYAYINGYSGQTIYDDYYITGYNMFFTAWPLMAKALFDQDISPAKNLDGTRFRSFLPKLYYVGQKSTVFNLSNYLLWVSVAILHSLIVFLIPYFVFNKAILVGGSGHDTDLWTFSITSFTAIIIVRTSPNLLYRLQT
jgi:magnesium-transporting ATPase (P-type)